MKKFLSTFQQSITSKRFYQGLESHSIKSSVGYYFTLVFIAALIFSVVISWNLLPTINSFAKNIGPTIIEFYPEDLEITIKDGVAHHNQEDPIFIPFAIPSATGFEIAESSTFPFRYALVIDTKNVYSEENFNKYETMIYLSQDNLVVAGEDGQIGTVTSLIKFPEDITINRRSVLSFIGDIQPLIRSLPAIVFFLIFIGGFFFYGFSFTRIIVAAIFIMLIYHLRGIKKGFGKSYQIAIHTSTLSFILIPGIFYLAGINIHIPFLFTALTVITAVLLMPQPKTVGPLQADQVT